MAAKGERAGNPWSYRFPRDETLGKRQIEADEIGCSGFAVCDLIRRL